MPQKPRLDLRPGVSEPVVLLISRREVEASDLESVLSRLKVFLATFRRHGRARLEVTARLDYRGTAAATFTGEYVAVRLPAGTEITAG